MLQVLVKLEERQKNVERMSKCHCISDRSSVIIIYKRRELHRHAVVERLRQSKFKNKFRPRTAENGTIQQSVLQWCQRFNFAVQDVESK